MTTDDRRITLITRGAGAPNRRWNEATGAPQRLVFVKAFTVLRDALVVHCDAQLHDVGRIIIDHAADTTEFLDLVATLIPELTADVLLIGKDYAFLSAIGRGGDRIMYRLSTADVEFYLWIHAVVLEDYVVRNDEFAFAGGQSRRAASG